MAANHSEDDIPPWKKHLIARLRVQNKCTINGNSAVTVSTSKQLSPQSPPFIQNKPSGRVPKPNNQTQTSAGIRVSPSTCNQLSATSSAAKSATNPSFSGKDGTSALSASKFTSPLTQRRIKSSNMVQERAWTVDYTSCESVDMVSENDNYSRTSDSDSSEELHYGPGIVKKLKNKYLSLALRRQNYTKERPSTLHLRKATSLENMLDGGDDEEVSAKTEMEQRRMFETNGTDKNSTNRYRNSKRGGQDMKRARSVEAISRFENMISPPPRIDNARPKSLHEYILINDTKEGNDKPYRKPKDSKVVEIEPNIDILFSNNYVPRLNRPKRITPVMNEREKPPADVVKQAKMIFEKRPEQRTKPPVNTGEVAAKIASYKNIIVQSKPVKKPPIKTKPVGAFLGERTVVKNGNQRSSSTNKSSVEDKVRPDTRIKMETRVKKPKVETVKKFVSEVDNPKITPKLRETSKKGNEKAPSPKEVKSINHDLFCKGAEMVQEMQKEDINQEEAPKTIQLPSPIPDVSIIEFTKSENDVVGRLCETPDLIMTTSPIAVSTPTCDKSPTENSVQNNAASPTLKIETEESTEARIAESVTHNKCDSDREHSPVIKTSSNENVPFNEPLRLIINGNQNRKPPSPVDSPRITQIAPIPGLTRRKIVSPPIRSQKEAALFDRVVEKNLINAAKSLEQSKPIGSVQIGRSEEKTEVLVPKKVRRPPREPESNSIVFKFTDRKDVPDYVQNDKSRTVGRLEKPKVGEGGIIILPGAALDETFTDEDEEIMKYLQAPPSPCDVTFINDNILIDGKSSINNKSKKNRMRISFVESSPDVYEYPSESSLLVDDLPSSESPALGAPSTSSPPLTGHTVPMLSGSSLANYTPKSTEEFQPGVTRSTPTPTPTEDDLPEDLEEEVEVPLAFSAGTNSDILF